MPSKKYFPSHDVLPGIEVPAWSGYKLYKTRPEKEPRLVAVVFTRKDLKLVLNALNAERKI